MTDQEINIAIAEHCGWRLNPDGTGFMPPGGDSWFGRIPNYCGDLNAMHEAEEVLNHRQRRAYAERLPTPEGLTNSIWAMTHATARQRAEAFLRTLGKWKDE